MCHQTTHQFLSRWSAYIYSITCSVSGRRIPFQCHVSRCGWCGVCGRERVCSRTHFKVDTSACQRCNNVVACMRCASGSPHRLGAFRDNHGAGPAANMRRHNDRRTHFGRQRHRQHQRSPFSIGAVLPRSRDGSKRRTNAAGGGRQPGVPCAPRGEEHAAPATPGLLAGERRLVRGPGDGECAVVEAQTERPAVQPCTHRCEGGVRVAVHAISVHVLPVLPDGGGVLCGHVAPAGVVGLEGERETYVRAAASGQHLHEPFGCYDTRVQARRRVAQRRTVIDEGHQFVEHHGIKRRRDRVEI
eukprot:m.1314841 g.1314841  ORF g.1314841 m.1314841 type:complete len:301 (-) comp24835_c0_seq60:2996-3898(-)